ncbi:MAG: hypothetical protein WA851_23095 [Xanthobacteraceae bacterium]
MSLSARRLLDRLEIEHAAHGGAENGKLPVTYDDFVRYGIHRHAIGPAIREAVALGFLKIRQSGRAGNADFRRPNSFELTYLSTQIGPTDDWAKIAEADAEVIAVAARSAASEKTKNQCRKTPSFSDGNRHRKQQIHSTETVTTGHSTETGTTIYISGREQHTWKQPQPDRALAKRAPQGAVASERTVTPLRVNGAYPVPARGGQ